MHTRVQILKSGWQASDILQAGIATSCPISECWPLRTQSLRGAHTLEQMRPHQCFRQTGGWRVFFGNRVDRTDRRRAIRLVGTSPSLDRHSGRPEGLETTPRRTREQAQGNQSKKSCEASSRSSCRPRPSPSKTRRQLRRKNWCRLAARWFTRRVHFLADTGIWIHSCGSTLLRGSIQ